MLDAVTDGKPMDFKVFQSSVGFFLSKISFTGFSFLFTSKIFNMILTFCKFLCQCEAVKTIFCGHGSTQQFLYEIILAYCFWFLSPCL